MLDSLDHVLIGVRDLDAATEAYSKLLGLETSWRGTHREGGTANSLYRLDNTYVELLAPSGSGPEGELLTAWLGERDAGLLGLAFGTPDAAECRNRLESGGLEPEAVLPGKGIDAPSGTERSWRRVPLPLARTRGVLLFAIEHCSPHELLPRAVPAESMDAVVTALDHTVVRTADAEGASRLYGEALGLRLALDRSFPDWGMRLLFFRVGGVTVEVAAALEPDPGADPATDLLWGLSYRVPDADAAHARLLAAGLEATDVRTGRKPGTRVLTVNTGTLGIPTLFLEASVPPTAEGSR